MFYKNDVVEYALELGLLDLSPDLRDRLRIPVMLVSLEPARHECFGGPKERFFLKHFFGYESVLISSVKSIAENEHDKGHMK